MANNTYRWTGGEGRGYRRQLRDVRRAQAEARNEAAQPVELRDCGHRHGAGRGCAA